MPNPDLMQIPKVIAGNPVSPRVLCLVTANFILATVLFGRLGCLPSGLGVAPQPCAWQFSSALSAAVD
jgi:hypothetical protein